MNSVTVERNSFENIYVDLTYKCNMQCPLCYNPQRDLPSMTIEYFEEVCARLPSRVTFRFLGGEPTLHPQFFEFLKIANKYRHVPSFVSNGIMLNDKSFVGELSRLKFPFYASITMDGGSRFDDVYEKIVGRRCADMKMKALRNMVDARISRIGIGAIIVRGLNEFVIPDLLELAKLYSGVQYLHFRTVGKAGRYFESDPYFVSDLKSLISKFFTDQEVNRRVLIDGKRDLPGQKCQQCCFYFRPNNRLEIALIEFASDRSRNCWRRGKLRNETFEIYPWFEDMVQFSNSIPERWKRGKTDLIDQIAEVIPR